ncbi:hypothetical protein AA19596_0160 [Acetobacter fabarum DSM 19596]|nr:hypothetical protein AA19596_0160 [Acetobacter fabarum DSM 19596]
MDGQPAYNTQNESHKDGVCPPSGISELRGSCHRRNSSPVLTVNFRDKEAPNRKELSGRQKP